jgi:diacylglycerol kinase family enzyme
MPSVLLFANPISGRGRGQKIAEHLAMVLKNAGFEVTTYLEPAMHIPPNTINRTAAAAVVIGGDGTLRTVARRLFEKPAMRPAMARNDPAVASPATAGPPLLVVPMGTANLMGQHLGVRWSGDNIEQFDAQIVQAIRQRTVVEFDMARANGEIFLLVAGVGLDSRIVEELHRHRTGPISLLSYILPLCVAMGTYSFPKLCVTVDGRRVFDTAPAMAFVGNIAEYGTGFPILPMARPDDALLDVCVLPCATHEDIAQHFLDAVAGQHLGGEGVVYLRGRHIQIDSPQPVAVQVDGEAAGTTPLDIELLPVRVPFILPR